MGCCLEPHDPFIITQYCEHGSLFEMLQDSSIPLSRLYKFRLAVGIARGLVYLHDSTPCQVHQRLKRYNYVVAFYIYEIACKHTLLICFLVQLSL